jgi:hypothetical protein
MGRGGAGRGVHGTLCCLVTRGVWGVGVGVLDVRPGAEARQGCKAPQAGQGGERRRHFHCRSEGRVLLQL